MLRCLVRCYSSKVTSFPPTVKGPDRSILKLAAQDAEEALRKNPDIIDRDWNSDEDLPPLEETTKGDTTKTSPNSLLGSTQDIPLQKKKIALIFAKSHDQD